MQKNQVQSEEDKMKTITLKEALEMMSPKYKEMIFSAIDRTIDKALTGIDRQFMMSLKACMENSESDKKTIMDSIGKPQTITAGTFTTALSAKFIDLLSELDDDNKIAIRKAIKSGKSNKLNLAQKDVYSAVITFICSQPEESKRKLIAVLNKLKPENEDQCDDLPTDEPYKAKTNKSNILTYEDLEIVIKRRCPTHSDTVNFPTSNIICKLINAKSETNEKTGELEYHDGKFNISKEKKIPLYGYLEFSNIQTDRPCDIQSLNRLIAFNALREDGFTEVTTAQLIRQMKGNANLNEPIKATTIKDIETQIERDLLMRARVSNETIIKNDATKKKRRVEIDKKIDIYEGAFLPVAKHIEKIQGIDNKTGQPIEIEKVTWSILDTPIILKYCKDIHYMTRLPIGVFRATNGKKMTQTISNIITYILLQLPRLRKRIGQGQNLMTVTTILDAIGDKCDDNTTMAKKRYKKHIEEIKSVLEGLKKQKMIKKWDVYGMEHGQPHGFIVVPGDVVSSWMLENQDSQNSKVSGNE